MDSGYSDENKELKNNKVVITSSTETYTIRPASKQELRFVAKQEYAKVLDTVECVSEPDVRYIAPGLIEFVSE